MPSPDNDSYVRARREFARGVPSSLKTEQGRVIDLMRRRARGSSLAALHERMQELEREIERLRGGTHGGPA